VGHAQTPLERADARQAWEERERLRRERQHPGAAARVVGGGGGQKGANPGALSRVRALGGVPTLLRARRHV
jgi:hypothetical protein